MTRLTDAQVDHIARALARQLGRSRVGAGRRRRGRRLGGNRRRRAPVPALGTAGGVFATVDECVAAARAAFEDLQGMTLEPSAPRSSPPYRAAMLREAESLAREAVQETRLGRFEHKVLKNRLVTEATPGTEILVPQAVTGDDGLTLTEWAPFGVIGAITPTTNPTSTIICNTIGMVAAGNAVVFNVHPGAKRCSHETVRHLNAASPSVGGPPNLVTAVAEPTIETATALMHHAGVNLLVVTGGPGVVKAAMKSGKRAVCAGPGNPPVVVDETADLEKAGRDIVHGAGLRQQHHLRRREGGLRRRRRRPTACSRPCAPRGAYVAVAEPKLRGSRSTDLRQEIRGPRTHGVINKDWVGKNAGVILAARSASRWGDEVPWWWPRCPRTIPWSGPSS